MVAIAANGFSGLPITTVTMGKNVKTIGANAFKGCKNLSELTGADIGESVESIGNYAFADCSSLKRVWIRKSVKSIGDYAFKDCWKLDRVNFQQGGSVSIGKYAFPCDLAAEYKAGGAGVYNISWLAQDGVWIKD